MIFCKLYGTVAVKTLFFYFLLKINIFSAISGVLSVTVASTMAENDI